jgi:transcriptional regulator with XRE-family HTH domain
MYGRRWSMKLSDIIKNYIEEHNYTVRGFADICGISSSQMSLMARGINSNGTMSMCGIATSVLMYPIWYKKSPPRREGIGNGQEGTRHQTVLM